MLQIRKYRSEDRPALVALFRKNVPRYFGEEEEEDLVHYLNEYAATHYVAEEGGRLVGSGGFVVKERGSGDGTEREGWLSWYFVDPDVQGNGVGSRLVDHSLEHLQSAGADEIMLNTSQLAEHFFARFGFEETEREKDYWTEGLDLVAMRYAGGEDDG